MYYVYLLRSEAVPAKTYVGMTDDIEARLKKHNSGGSDYTSRFKPWELITYIAVRAKDSAAELEKYLKVGSGHAFAKKHLW